MDGFVIRYGAQDFEARLSVTRSVGGIWRLTYSLPGHADVNVGFDTEDELRHEINTVLAMSMEPAIDPSAENL
ncbi:hypothetical protein AB0L88_18425 [Saccharopolyspora shandongensis]|uniref:Uncharacterized protein n=1 Tax=Saccharopolyspora shandongensis TaxID=418495 RepID=A0A1H3RR33_9PSEU|nr:hypothetical protein [Saccharopolyspora shandongensis]SDZ28234.1 hypothetical protein SAMN05216215_105716 [Saccharopolyspora shandongensis]